MKTFIGILCVIIGAVMMKNAGASIGLSAGIFFLVIGGCSIMTVRKTSLNHL